MAGFPTKFRTPIVEGPGDPKFVLIERHPDYPAAYILVAGSNVTLTVDATAKTLTIASTGSSPPGTPGGWQFNAAANSSHALLTCMD